eukprot:NODE_552_length_6155_cov_0.827774.p5 type:complete len:128 gc:universal NODE_552_length_6155_cov_0.827774:4505-4122(-)
MLINRMMRNVANHAHDHAHYWQEMSQPSKYIPYFTKEFQNCDSRFDLIRLLNNAYSHQIVPPAEVVQEMLKACRKLNQYGLAVRALEGLKEKAEEHQSEYKSIMGTLEPTLKELGVEPIEQLGRLGE